MRTVGFIILFAGVIAIGYFGNRYLQTIRNKEDAMDYLEGVGKGSREKMTPMDENYLVAFANAVKNSSRNFTVGGKKYITQTGRAFVS